MESTVKVSKVLRTFRVKRVMNKEEGLVVVGYGAEFSDGWSVFNWSYGPKQSVMVHETYEELKSVRLSIEGTVVEDAAQDDESYSVPIRQLTVVNSSLNVQFVYFENGWGAYHKVGGPEVEVIVFKLPEGEDFGKWIVKKIWTL